jgi:hypothetical protein
MKIHLDYDRTLDVWTLRHGDLHMNTIADVTAWRRAIMEEMKKFRGQKVCLLIDVSGVTIDPAVAPEYGRFAREVVETHTTCAIRYGSVDGWTAAELRLQAVINRYPARVVRDREAALEALRNIRSQSKR